MRTHCECTDPGCPAHPGASECPRRARKDAHRWRVDMDDLSGVAFCPDCAADADESGVFTSEIPEGGYR